MDTLLSLLVGLGFSAACGFRLFVPFFILSVASLSGHLTLPESFSWIGSWSAFIAFGAATVLEVTGYYFPLVDNFLDTVATPAAVVAGTIATAAMATGMDPFLKWSVAIIAGGGVAGLIKSTTAVMRAASSLTSGGILNPMMATAELGGSIGATLLTLVAPILMTLVLGVLLIVVVARLAKRNSPARPTLI